MGVFDQMVSWRAKLERAGFKVSEDPWSPTPVDRPLPKADYSIIGNAVRKAMGT